MSKLIKILCCIIIVGMSSLVNGNDTNKEPSHPFQTGILSSIITFFHSYFFKYSTKKEIYGSENALEIAPTITDVPVIDSSSKEELHPNDRDFEETSATTNENTASFNSQEELTPSTEPVQDATALTNENTASFNSHEELTPSIEPVQEATQIFLESTVVTYISPQEINKSIEPILETSSIITEVTLSSPPPFQPEIPSTNEVFEKIPPFANNTPASFALAPQNNSVISISEIKNSSNPQTKRISKRSRRAQIKQSKSTTLAKLNELPRILTPSGKVDFFDSMGWYLRKNHLLRKTYFLNKKQKSNHNLSRLNELKALYDRNHFLVKSGHDKKAIPKIIHQIWVGPKTPPTIFKESQESIKKHHPGWEYKLWTDEDIPHLQLYNQGFYNASVNYGEKADILRYELLYRYGGIYLDVDFVCLKPLDELLQYDLFVSIQPLDCEGEIANGIIGSIASHPILQDCMVTIKDDWHAFNPSSVVDKVGPRHFQKSFMRFVKNGASHIIAFPASFFYPIGLKDRLIGLENNNGKNNHQISSLLKPETFAIHYWTGSWWDNTENEKRIR
ncbi:hypothetical protein H0X06_06930 [Candidatus Dependentiae bacterium]|nr:hypothetical protein [Candidatus Dependentiae bacterium]